MKKNQRALWLMLLVLGIGLFLTGKTVQAATYRQIAYVNSGEKRLVLKFNEFCSSGYTWNVTAGTSTTPILSGSFSGGSVGSAKAVKVNLGSNYKSKTKYTLTVLGKNKKKLVVKYYTGGALQSSSVIKSTNDVMKSSTTLSSSYNGSGIEFLVFKGSDSTALLASAKHAITSKTGSTIKTSATIPASQLANGKYKTYVIVSYTIDGATYYGQGNAQEFDYLKTIGKVTSVRVSTANSRVKLVWNAAANASYYKVYQSLKKNSGYKCVASKVTKTYYSREVKGGHTYYYKVEAYGEAGARKVSGGKSNVFSIKVTKTPGKVTGVKFGYDFSQNLVLRWSKSINTTGYIVYYKKSTDKAFQKLGSTKNRVLKLSKLDGNTTYQIKVQSYLKSGGKTIKAQSASKVLTINPNQYVKKNRQLLLANSVRTIEHIGSRSIYTTKHYSNEVKLAFVNVNGYESKTDYLIWISHYTQQVTIYKGSKGKWKIIRSFICGSGAAVSPSPIGVFKTTYKETGWYYVSTKELYVTHYCGRNSFHTRPLYNDGSICTATIGRPVSHGCARLYNQDAKYIYDHIPSGTTVVSY